MGRRVNLFSLDLCWTENTTTHHRQWCICPNLKVYYEKCNFKKNIMIREVNHIFIGSQICHEKMYAQIKF